MNDNKLSVFELVNIDDINYEEEPEYDVLTSISREAFTSLVEIAAGTEIIEQTGVSIFFPKHKDLQQVSGLLEMDQNITEKLLNFSNIKTERAWVL